MVLNFRLSAFQRYPATWLKFQNESLRTSDVVMYKVKTRRLTSNQTDWDQHILITASKETVSPKIARYCTRRAHTSILKLWSFCDEVFNLYYSFCDHRMVWCLSYYNFPACTEDARVTFMSKLWIKLGTCWKVASYTAISYLSTSE